MVIIYFMQRLHNIELYRLEKIKEHAALWKELGGISVNIFDDDINKKMTSLLTYDMILYASFIDTPLFKNSSSFFAASLSKL